MPYDDDNPFADLPLPPMDDDDGEQPDLRDIIEGGEFSPTFETAKLFDDSDAILGELLDALTAIDAGKVRGDFLVDLDSVENTSDLRGQSFTNISDAVLWLHRTGLLGIGYIVYDPDDDIFTAGVDSDTN